MVTAEPALLALHEAGRRFGSRWVLAHINLQVREGQVVLVAGSNGSGKTTLLRILAGLLPPSVGELVARGERVGRDRTVVRALTSFVSHSLSLYPDLTGAETVELWGRLLGRAVDETEVRRRLVQLGLDGHGDRRVVEYSAGMKKRLSLARVWLEPSRVLLLDEPFSSLDPEGVRWLSRAIRSWREEGRAIVLTSHDLERAVAVADRAVVLQEGQIVEDGTPSVVRRRGPEEGS